MRLTTQSVIIKNKSVLENEIDGEKIMLNMDKGEYYGMDKIASRIWELLNEEIEIEKLIQKLLEEFEIDYETCKNDVLEFLDGMLKKNLIVLK